MSTAFNPDPLGVATQPLGAAALPKKKTRKIYRRTARGAISTTIATVNEDEEATEPAIPFEEVNFRPSRGFRRSGEEYDDRDENGSIVDDGSSVASSRYSLVSELTQSVAPSIAGGTPRPDFERIPSQIGMKSFSALSEHESSPRKSVASSSALDDSGRSGYSSEAGRTSPLPMMGVSSRGDRDVGRDSPLSMTVGANRGDALTDPHPYPPESTPENHSQTTSSMMLVAAKKRGSLPSLQEENISPSSSMDLPQTNSGLFREPGVEEAVVKPSSSLKYLSAVARRSHDELDEAEQQRHIMQSQKVNRLQKQNRRLCVLLVLVIAGGAIAIALVIVFLVRK